MVGAADYGDVAMGDDAVFDGVHGGRGNVHHDIFVAEREIHPGEPLRAGGQLLETDVGGNVHRAQSRAGDDPGLLEAVAELEVLDGGGERRSPGRSIGFGADDVALDRQPPAQQRHRCALGAGRKRGGHEGPAAGSTIAA